MNLFMGRIILDAAWNYVLVIAKGNRPETTPGPAEARPEDEERDHEDHYCGSRSAQSYGRFSLC
jgi:hypothetical protein